MGQVQVRKELKKQTHMQEGNCGTLEASCRLKIDMTEDVLGVENVTYVVDNRTEEGDIWMTQAAIAVILGTTQQNVAYHLNKKFDSGELSKEENKVDPNLTNNFCKLKINTRTDNQPFLYNFDALMAVVYSVNSKQAISIRKWSNQVLKRFSTTGLVVDPKKALYNEASNERIIELAFLARVIGKDEMEEIQKFFKGATDYDAKSEKTKKIMKNKDFNHPYYLTVILTFLLVALYFVSPINLTIALYLPFLVNFVISNIALPLLLVLAEYVLPLTFKVSFTFFIALFLLVLSVVAYFFVFVLTLNVFAEEISFVGIAFTMNLQPLIFA